MEHLTILDGFRLALTVLMVLVIVSDTVRYTIPNLLNAAIVVLWLVGLFFLPVAPLSALAAAGIVLVVGMGMFALGLMGGGDAKLLVALALWFGWSMELVQFLFATTVLGGVLVIIVLLLRITVPPVLFRLRPERPLPRVLTRKQPVPYGIAIAAAFLLLLAQGGVPPLA